jgi:hypothetical protein
MTRDVWLRALRDLHDEMLALLSDRKQRGKEHQEAYLAEAPLEDELRQSMWRLRNYAGDVIQRWDGPPEALDSYLLIAIVDLHDAAVDALATLVSGGGAPSIALLRRFYELTLLVVAGWEKPVDLEEAMRRALTKSRPDDHYAGLAKQGVLGANLPHVSVLRSLVGDEETTYARSKED